jgi:hypothetical protein
MSSYLLALLVIFFLQNQNKLPSVSYLQRFASEYKIDGWKAEIMNFRAENLKIVQVYDMKRLLHDFFKFYGSHFDFEHLVVCPFLGEAVKKSIFDPRDLQQLEGLFERYKQYMDQLNLNKADKIRDLFAYKKPFVVQDPYEHIHNVAKGFTTKQTKTFKDNCRQSWIIMREQLKY